VTLEVPPREAVLRAENGGIRAEDGLETGGKVGQAVRLDPEEYHIGGTDGGQVTRDRRADLEVFLADDSKTPLLHGLQVRPPGEQGDVAPGSRQAGSDIAAYGAGPGYNESHADSPAYAAATMRR
jgi:hypothetical protein